MAEPIKQTLVKWAWIQVIFLLVVSFVATWIRGWEPEVVLGWILLVPLCILMLCTAYQIRQAFLGAGVLLVAIALLCASFLHGESWSVGRSDLLEWSVGAAAFAAWLFAWDARTHKTDRRVSAAAGLLAVLGLIIYAALALLLGPETVTRPGGLLSLAIIGALADLAEGRWKWAAAIAAVMASGVLLATILTKHPV